MLNLIKSIAVQDQTVATNIAYLDNIMSGVDGATTFGYSIVPTALQINDNQKQQYLHDHALDIRVMRGTDTGILDAITVNNRQVKISGYTPNGFILWNTAGYVTQSEAYDNRIISRQIRLTKTTVPGYASGQQQIYAGGNGLALYDILSRTGNEFADYIASVLADGGTVFADRSSVADEVGVAGAQASLIVPCGEGADGKLYYYGDNAETLNGFTLTGDLTGSVSGSTQYLTYVSTGRLQSESILFPFESVPLTFSVDTLTSSGSGNGQITIGIEYLDNAGAVISSSTAFVDDQSAGARYPVSGTTPTNTNSVRVFIGDFDQATAGDVWSLARPSLTVGNSTQFTL